MSDEEYRHHIWSLNKNQYEFFSHIMNVATKKDKQELCWLNGGAGTEKSHLLKALCHDLEKFQGTKFFLFTLINTLTTFKVHGISSKNCLTLNVIGFNEAISCSTRSDELVNCQNSSDI